MVWIFLGYTCGIYASFATWAKLGPPAQWSPRLLLIYLPLLFIVFGTEVFFYASWGDRQNVRDAIARHPFFRRHLLFTGAAAGAFAVAMLVSLYWTDGFGTGSQMVSVMGGILMLLGAPIASCEWAFERSCKLLEPNPGFPIIQQERQDPR